MDTNQDTGIVPLTEATMREYFQRVVDHVAGLSTQAAQVTGLQNAVSDLSNRLANLEAENANLRKEVSEAWEYAHRMEAETQGSSAAKEAAEQHVQALKDVIVQRDTAVSSLSQAHESEKAQHRITMADRDDARQRAEELTTRLAARDEAVRGLEAERDHWIQKANGHSSELEEVRGKLDRIQSLLSPSVVPFAQSA